MLAEALILIAAFKGLDAFDDANLALTTCGFAAYRHASELDQSVDQFARTLSSRCSGEIAGLKQEIIDVETRRGKSRATASASADAIIGRFRAQFAADYARRGEREAQFRALERALLEEGKTNAP